MALGDVIVTATRRLATKGRNQYKRMRAEAALWAHSSRSRGDNPRVLFFPSGEAEGASLLRAHNVSRELGKLGWVSAVVPPVVKLAGRRRIVLRFRPDLLVFQQCRHELNDGDLSFGVPYVVDTDDADFHLEIPHLAERLERTVRSARGVIAGGRYVAEHHRRANPNVTVIWTGTPISNEPWSRHSERESKGPPILTWAQARPLDYRRELDFVIDLDRRLREGGSNHRLRFYGIDTDADRAAIASHFGAETELELLPTLDYPSFTASLREVAVGLCPLITQSPFSRGKSFGKILGYLDAGVPVVASDAADHALLFDEGSGVVTNDPMKWEEAVRTLLSDPSERDRMADRAGIILRERLSMEAVGKLTDEFLRNLLN